MFRCIQAIPIFSRSLNSIVILKSIQHPDRRNIHQVPVIEKDPKIGLNACIQLMTITNRKTWLYDSFKLIVDNICTATMVNLPVILFLKK